MSGQKSPYTWFEKDLIRSKAFRGLTSTAKDVYLHFLLKRQFRNSNRNKKHGKGVRMEIINNGKICFPYSEAEKIGIPRPTFARALDNLVERGLIDITHAGSGGVKGDMSLYAISDRWEKFGTDEFIEAHREPDPRCGGALRRYHKKQT